MLCLRTTLLIALVSTGAAAAERPTKAGLARQLATVTAQRAAAEARATREVADGRFRDRDLFGSSERQTKAAIEARTRQLFGRTQRRLLKALGDADALLDQGAPDEAAAVIDAWRLNRKASVEREVPRRAVSLVKQRTGLGRDSQHRPGTPATDVDQRAIYRGKRAPSPAAIYGGPWSAKDDELVLPGADVVLELAELRDLDADGMHPSVVGRDPRTGVEVKLKLGDGLDVSSAAIVSRLVSAMGYHPPQAAYLLPEVKVSPQMLVAAYRHQNKVGVRVREDGALASVGVRPGKYGFAWLKMDPRQIVGVALKAGGTLTGAPAIALLRRAMDHADAMDAIDHVALRNVTAETEENAGHAVGPWDPDAPGLRDRRAIRAFSMAAAWLGASDVRRSNAQVIVAKQKGKAGAAGAPDEPDTLDVRYVFTDSGSALSFKDPSRFSPTVKVDPRAKQISDAVNTVNKAFDRTQPEDAAWGVSPAVERGLASLTTGQIEGAVAAGVRSYPLARFYASRLIARRNDLVRKLGLEGVHPLLPEPALGDVRGGGAFELDAGDGTTTRVTMPEGGFRVIAGELVRVP